MRNLTIGKRMALAFGSIGVLIVLMIGVMFFGLRAEENANDVAITANAKARAAGDLSYATVAMLYNGAVVEGEAVAGRPNSPRATQAAKDFGAAAGQLDTATQLLSTMELDAVDAPLISRVESEISSYRNTEAKAISLFQEGTPASIKAATELIAASQSSSSLAELGGELRALIADVRADADAGQEDASAVGARTATLIVVVGILCLALAVVLALVTTRSITRPIGRSVKALEGLANGDLRTRLDDDSADEVGQMSRALNTALVRMNETVVGIELGAERLAGASIQLSEVAQRMSAAAEQSAGQAQSVSAAAEEVSHGIQTVAASAEELGSSEEEIARNTSNAATIAESAVASAGAVNATVERLGESSTEIGIVVNVITSVAEQINLLALNATIEAARAGAAGESFAVVASEVKNLARKTAKSSDEIRSKIEVMQHNTQEAISAISEITNIIDQISGTQMQVAAAVEEQTTATGEIGRSMSQAAVGSSEIARSITEVAEAAASHSQAASDTQAMAQDVTEVVTELNAYVSRFTIDESNR